MQSLGCEVAALNTVHYSMLHHRIGSYRDLIDPRLLTRVDTKAIILAIINSRVPKHRQKRSADSMKVSSRVTLQTSMSCFQDMRLVQMRLKLLALLDEI